MVGLEQGDETTKWTTWISVNSCCFRGNMAHLHCRRFRESSIAGIHLLRTSKRTDYSLQHLDT